MNFRYMDIHSHLDSLDYKDDFEAVISRMKEASVGTITIGTDLESAKNAVALAEAHNNIWACIGIHPADNHTEIWNEEEFENLVKNPKVVAIGECGLDYFRLPKIENVGDMNNGEIDLEKAKAEIARQKELFEKQIKFAIKHDKTLMIHCRDAKKGGDANRDTANHKFDAPNDIYEILARYKTGDLSGQSFGDQKIGANLRIHFHFFAGDLEMTKKLLKLDATFSFTGVITFAGQYDEVIKFLPIEKIMSETDAPWVAPTPYRGKRNEPSYVIEVIKKIAQIRGEDFEKVSIQLLENVVRIFKI